LALRCRLKGLGDTKGDTAARTQGATSRRIRSSPHCDREQTIVMTLAPRPKRARVDAASRRSLVLKRVRA
jgi:hypothetical protein